MKHVSENGFWNIENNPISKVGVFPYLGKNISDELEPNKIYFVYRPAEELFSDEAIKSFNENPLPLVDDHEMLGDGATPAEKKGIDGVISNVRREGDELIGDITIYSEKMKDKINSGKKDLSMGYYCEYDLQDGEYEGQHYDAVQRNLRGNHVALVDEGRCGHSVRVFDSFNLDAADNLNNKELEMTDFVEETEDAQFEESKHPRADNGQFTSGSGGGSGGKSSSNNSEASEKKDNTTKSSDKKTFRTPLSNVGINLDDPYTLQNYSYIKKNIETKIKDFSDYVKNKSGSLKKVGEMQLEAANAELERLENFYKKAKENPKVQKLFQQRNTTADSSKEFSVNSDKEKMPMADFIEEKEDEEIVKDTSVDKRELIREIGAIAGQAGMSDELVRTLMQKAEQLAYNGSEESQTTDAKCGDENPEEIEEEVKETEDADDEEKEDISKIVEKKVEDALKGIDIMALIEAKKNMLEKVRPLVGDFDASKMSNKDIAKYACDKLNIKATVDSANDVLNCYLNLKGGTKIYSTLDARDDSAAEIIEKYKRGE